MLSFFLSLAYCILGSCRMGGGGIHSSCLRGYWPCGPPHGLMNFNELGCSIGTELRTLACLWNSSCTIPELAFLSKYCFCNCFFFANSFFDLGDKDLVPEYPILTLQVLKVHIPNVNRSPPTPCPRDLDHKRFSFSDLF